MCLDMESGNGDNFELSKAKSRTTAATWKTKVEARSLHRVGKISHTNILFLTFYPISSLNYIGSIHFFVVIVSSTATQTPTPATRQAAGHRSDPGTFPRARRTVDATPCATAISMTGRSQSCR